MSHLSILPLYLPASRNMLSMETTFDVVQPFRSLLKLVAPPNISCIHTAFPVSQPPMPALKSEFARKALEKSETSETSHRLMSALNGESANADHIEMRGLSEMSPDVVNQLSNQLEMSADGATGAAERIYGRLRVRGRRSVTGACVELRGIRERGIHGFDALSIPGPDGPVESVGAPERVVEARHGRDVPARDVCGEQRRWGTRGRDLRGRQGAACSPALNASAP